MLYNLVYYFLLFVCVFSILAIVVFAREKDVTTCRLASQILQEFAFMLELTIHSGTSMYPLVQVSAPGRYVVSIDPMKNRLRLRM